MLLHCRCEDVVSVFFYRYFLYASKEEAWVTVYKWCFNSVYGVSSSYCGGCSVYRDVIGVAKCRKAVITRIEQLAWSVCGLSLRARVIAHIDIPRGWYFYSITAVVPVGGDCYLTVIGVWGVV